MNWFEGEIAQAISTSKTKGAIFVVYIYGKDEKSSQITESINQQEVAQILGGENFVAIKIEAESVSYQQFSQIYKQVPVPSIYFIGKQGVPIEIITEVQDAKSFQDRLGVILQKGGVNPVATQVKNFINNESKPEESAPTSVPENVICENGVCTIKRDDQPSTSQASTSEHATEEETENLSVEEKVERAKKLLEKKREEKEAEEKENERQKEIERRKMGQNVQQMKRWQEDEKLKQVLEEREKEKRENQAARERVLAQIAQDKAERATKFSPAAPSPKPAPAPQVSPKPVNTNTARLQFRMPDGQTSTKDFASTETLENVHSYIRANLNLPFSRYTLATTFPRREFTSAENNHTLLDLGLVPTAVILILPVNTLATNKDGFLSGLLWPLLAPIITLFMYLKTFLFGSGPADNPSGSDNQNKRSADSNNDPRVQAKVRRAGETTVIKRQGNIHRLANKKDSDDENNTWNGNSTQQM